MTQLSYSYDSNNPLMVGDVGLAGVAIDSVDDMNVRVGSLVVIVHYILTDSV